MRTFIDGILDFIGSTSLTDDEWTSLSDLTEQVYNLENYTRILATIDARETVSGTRERFTDYFKAAGVAISETPESEQGKSNIFVGEAL